MVSKRAIKERKEKNLGYAIDSLETAIDRIKWYLDDPEMEWYLSSAKQWANDGKWWMNSIEHLGD